MGDEPEKKSFPSRRFKIFLPIVIVIVVAGILSIINQESRGEKKQVFLNTPEAVVRNIAKEVSMRHSVQGTFTITYAEVIPHSSLISPMRGVHYNISGIKFVDEITEENIDALTEALNYLLRTTTEKVLKGNGSISYIAIQVLPPDVWAQGFGGSVQKPGYLYIAKRDELMALLELNNENTAWILATAGTTLDLVESNILNEMRKSYGARKQEAEKEMLERQR